MQRRQKPCVHRKRRRLRNKKQLHFITAIFRSPPPPHIFRSVKKFSEGNNTSWHPRNEKPGKNNRRRNYNKIRWRNWHSDKTYASYQGLAIAKVDVFNRPMLFITHIMSFCFPNIQSNHQLHNHEYKVYWNTLQTQFVSLNLNKLLGL